MSIAAPDGHVRAYLHHHFRHFNAAELLACAEAYSALVERGGKVIVSLAGAMSTAELGVSLAEMIRRGKVHAVCCTGANLEEDVFNLFGRKRYRHLPHYRDLPAEAESSLFEEGFNRVTDVAIPELVIRQVEDHLTTLWQAAATAGTKEFPHAYLCRLVLDSSHRADFQIDPRDSWVHAAAETGTPIFVPGWEDSTLGNVFAARVMDGTLPPDAVIRPGIDYLISLVSWYREHCTDAGIGLLQIGGGIAGDFTSSVVPLIRQDLREDAPVWAFFGQISDSTTSYGSYSGAVPNEKITWGKLTAATPRFIIESDATIVAPLLFGYVLGY